MAARLRRFQKRFQPRAGRCLGHAVQIEARVDLRGAAREPLFGAPVDGCERGRLGRRLRRRSGRARRRRLPRHARRFFNGFNRLRRLRAGAQGARSISSPRARARGPRGSRLPGASPCGRPCRSRLRPCRRQRRFLGAERRVDRARHQHEEAARVLEPPGDGAGVDAGAEINVGARRADDGGAGVLRQHHAAERRHRGFILKRQLGLDPERRAIGVDGAIDRDRALAHQRQALRADRLGVGREARRLRGKRRRTCSSA